MINNFVIKKALRKQRENVINIGKRGKINAKILKTRAKQAFYFL